MTIRLVLVAFLSMTSAFAQQGEAVHGKGVIYGVAIGQDGKPARGVGLTALQLGVGSAGRLPYAKTNQAGEYRFESLDFGRYAVSGDDEEVGYSFFSTGQGRNDPPEVELTAEHPEAELRVFLTPKAGFVHIHLTNRRTGAVISGMQVSLSAMESPDKQLFSMSCYSNHVVLVEPDKNLQLHVTSDGYREWDESVGRGKPLHLRSGTRLTLAVQLEPSD
jgi:hypothetical protein